MFNTIHSAKTDSCTLSTYGKILIRVQNTRDLEYALSVSPFFVFDDNTRICKHNTYYDKITIVQR
jgi:hypothetical protein